MRVIASNDWGGIMATRGIDGYQLLIVDEPDVDWCQPQLMLLFIILQEKEYDIPKFYQ